MHNVDTRLYQPCFNVASTLVRTILNSIGLVMIVDLQIVFILLNDKVFLLTIQLLKNKILKNLLAVVHIVIHNGGKLMT